MGRGGVGGPGEHRVDPAQADIAWLTESIPVNVDSENMDILFGRINDELQKSPALVVIDTLARCFDGDENLQEDMGRFIGGIDRLRREFDTTVIVVHHTRLDADRERGSTAFRGAADTMVYCRKSRDGELELTCNKQKDAEEFLTRHFGIKKVLLPPHVATGESQDSIVLVEPSMEVEQHILSWLADTEGLTFTALKGKATEKVGNEAQARMSPATLKRRLVSLRENGKIIRESGIYRLKRVHGKTP